jgi:hypothetical protein
MSPLLLLNLNADLDFLDDVRWCSHDNLTDGKSFTYTHQTLSDDKPFGFDLYL